MTRLNGLRTRLQQLRRWRSLVRWGNALSVLLMALLLSWGVAFLLDWWLHFDWWLRAIVLVIWGSSLAAVIHRWLWPWMKVRESLADVALSVERAHDIDSDLVAALEFDEQPALAWGSPRLTTAVVNYVAEFSESLDVFRGFQYDGLPQRLTATVGSLVLALVISILFPQETSTFWNRFWLGTARYPTRTVISAWILNGQSLPVHHPDRLRIALPQGQPLQFSVLLTGELPSTAIATVRGLTTGERATWRLTANSSEEFGWQQSQLTESVRLNIHAGDAESDAVQIDVVPLPVVELAWTVTPPAYAATTVPPSTLSGSRAISALQGSQIQLAVTGLNKPLKTVEFQLDDQRIPLEMDRAATQPQWVLPAATILEELNAPVSYRLLVTDEDQLSPQPPIQGEIRLQTDRVPRVAVAVVSRKVLPTAVPVMNYGATDDFGIKSIVAQIVVTRAEGESETFEESIWPTAPERVTVPTTTVRGEYPLRFSAWKLQKGDEVSVTVIAEDERGTLPSQQGPSEPLIFEVTDRNGILESLLEIDQQSAKQLDEIIERELGIGRSTR